MLACLPQPARKQNVKNNTINPKIKNNELITLADDYTRPSRYRVIYDNDTDIQIILVIILVLILTDA